MADSDSVPTAVPRILVGVDGSEDALRAVRYAWGTARRTDADIWLVHAVDDGVLTGGWGVLYDPTILSQVGQDALDDATAYLGELGFPEDRIHTDVLMGHPTAVLADLTEAAALCVVGRRATGGLERMFVGSTSVSLAGSAHCPVVVISAASTPEATGKLKRIAVALTSPDRGKLQLKWALTEARSRKARLTVVQVVPPPPKGLFKSFQGPADPNAQAEAKARLEEMVSQVRLENPDVDIDAEVLDGLPIEDLIGQTQEVDLLVVGIHTHPVTGVTYGGGLRGVLAHAACPVALIR